MRTRTLFAASAAAAAIAVAGVVGVASADGPATPANRTVTVTGDANLSVSCGKDRSDVDAVYREALGQALAEAQGKAGFIAGTVGATLGVAQTVNENSSAGDPCATPVVSADPAAGVDDSMVTDAPAATGGVSASSGGSGISAPSIGAPAPEIDIAPDVMVKPVPQPDPQVWASVTVTYVMS